jgi:hypothetical protein
MLGVAKKKHRHDFADYFLDSRSAIYSRCNFLLSVSWNLNVVRSARQHGFSRAVSAPTALVNAARGLTKSYGARLPKCGTEQMNREITKELKPELREALNPLLAEIESLNARIAEYDTRIELIAKEVYREIARLKQVKGVGPLFPWVAPRSQELRYERAAAAHQ